MDYCFENRCEVNERMIVDYHKAQEKKMRTLRMVVTVVGAVVLIEMLAGVLLEMIGTAFALVTVVINLTAMYLLWFSTPMVIKKTVDYFRGFAGSQSAEPTYQFGDTIRVMCDGRTMELPYKQITTVELFADHVVLGVHKNMMLFIAIDGFTKGTFSEFKQFLRTKRPDLKIPE